MLFQAGSSTRGRAFAASHAEGVFVVETKETLAGPNNVIKDIRAQAAGIGRDPASIKFFQGITPVVGATEHEARQKAEELMEQISMDGMLAHISGSIGIDLSNIDLDASLETIQTGSMRGWTKSLIEAEPNKKKTFRDLIRARTAGRFLVGSPEQVADELGTFFDAALMVLISPTAPPPAPSLISSTASYQCYETADWCRRNTNRAPCGRRYMAPVN